LESFGHDDHLDFDEDGRVKTRRESTPQADKSFHTSSTSTANLKDGVVLESLRKNVGIVFKCNLSDLVRSVFLVLKEMRIVWKKWNSDFVYKCQSGVPIQETRKYNNTNGRMQELYENDLIKFFVHFSSIPKKKELIDFDQRSKNEAEYLVSFIWIKGDTMKYLDFINMFRLNIEDRV
jgi:hypothetical protein